MTREDIIKMARNVGIVIDRFDIDVMSEIDLETLERFANRVAEHERELCMKAIEDEVADWDREAKEAALEAAEAIRGEK